MKTKTFIIIAAVILVIGIAFCSVTLINNSDLTIFETSKCETNDYEIDSEFKNISITTTTSDIVLVPSNDKRTTVICYEKPKEKHKVTVKDDTLFIELNDTRKWYEYIGISFSSTKITVNIPKDEYNSLNIRSHTGRVDIPDGYVFDNIDVITTTGDIAINASAKKNFKAEASTGNITVANAEAGAIDLSVSTGKISVTDLICAGEASFSTSTGKTELNNLKCLCLMSEGSTGSLILDKVTAKTTFSIIRDTGDVIFDECDAAEIFVETDTGDVKGNFLSDKIFLVETDTGHIEVPKTIRGGKCEITTDTGDIKINISDR